MAAITTPTFLGTLLTICCFATLCLSYDFNDQNPITLESDGPSDDAQSTAFSSMDDVLDQVSFAHLFSPPVEAIYQFGDSMSDTGNFVRDKPWSNYNQFPYGETYFGKPAGRCSNGLLMVDYFECKKELTKGLFLMGEIGGNDYNCVFFQSKPISVAYEMVPEVVQTIHTAIEEIIDVGATRIIVPGNFPIGCMTMFLALFISDDEAMYDDHKCLKHLNIFAMYHNDKLQEAIRGLQKDHPDIAIVYADYYSAFNEVFQHPTYYGFEKNVTQRACCGTGDSEYNFNLGRLCGKKGVSACQNPQDYMSWDGIHPTQHAYHVMANWLMKRILFGISNVI